MDWITSLFLAMLRCFGIRVHQLGVANDRLVNGRNSAIPSSRNGRAHGGWWCIRVPLVGWYWLRVEDLRLGTDRFSSLGAFISRKRSDSWSGHIPR
jgi:hypothetical protein